MAEPNDEFFTVAELAALFKVDPKTILRWVKRGALVAHRFEGSLRVSDADYKTFVRSRREPKG
jgi:excisionase family DNA binding protein